MEDWESYQGPAQSRFFSQIAIENLPSWLIENLQRQSLTLADWGCAQGDGTDVWASYVDSQRIFGIDFSSLAVEQATRRYPAIRFLNENWLTEEPAGWTLFDVVFSSNTLEHFHRPYAVLETLCNHATKALVLALPYRELDRLQEHFFTFLPDNIPATISGRFRLVWSRVVDCSRIPNTHWSGDQIILVYAEPSWVDSLGLKLRDLGIQINDSETEIHSLYQAVSDRDSKIASLNQAIVERDMKLNAAYLEIALLKSELQKINSRIKKKILIFMRQLKQLPYFVKRWIDIMKPKN